MTSRQGSRGSCSTLSHRRPKQLCPLLTQAGPPHLPSTCAPVEDHYAEEDLSAE